MNYVSSRNKGPQKNIKDYILPIISVIFILVLFVSVLSGDKKTTTNQVTNSNAIKISLSSQETVAYTIGATGTKEKIDSSSKTLNPGEKVQVSDGMIFLEGVGVKLKLNKLGELKLNDDNSFSLESSDLWGEFESGAKINLNYMNINASAGSVINFSQNEVSSRVYVFKGFVSLKTLSGNSINLAAGSTLALMMDESNNPSIDLKAKQETIPDYIKTDDWFIGNNVSYYLDNIASMSGGLDNSGQTSTGITTTQTGSDQSNRSSNSSSSYINIDFPKDEYVSETQTIDIRGTVLDPSIVKIAFDYDKATINNGQFSIKGFELKNKTNDIVYRLYDANDNLMQKGVVTVYYTNAKTTDTSSTSTNKYGLENYSLNSSDFKFISPTPNPYTTSDDVVLIEGRVPAKTVAKVIVNGFALTKFVSGGTYWKYYANAATDNLKEGLNLYKVEYYDSNSKLLTTNVFTIIKKAQTTTSDTGSVDTSEKD